MFTNCRHRGPLECLLVKLSQAVSGLVVCLMAIQADQAVCLAQHHAPPPPGAIRLGQPPMPGTQFQQPPRTLPREDFSSEEEPVEEWVEEETPKKRKKDTQIFVPVLPPSKQTLKAAPTPSEAYEIARKKDERSRNMDDWLAIADNWDKKLGEAKDNVEKSKDKLDSAQKELTSLNDKIPKVRKEFWETVEKKTRQFDTKYPHTVDAVESPDYGTERSRSYKKLQLWNDAIAQFQQQYPEREIPSQYIKERDFFSSNWEQTKGKGAEARDQNAKMQLEFQKMDRVYWNLIARQDAVSSSVTKLENEVYYAKLAVFNADARKKESLTYADLRKPQEITHKKEDVKTPKEEKKIEWTVYDPNYHQKAVTPITISETNYYNIPVQIGKTSTVANFAALIENRIPIDVYGEKIPIAGYIWTVSVTASDTWYYYEETKDPFKAAIYGTTNLTLGILLQQLPITNPALKVLKEHIAVVTAELVSQAMVYVLLNESNGTFAPTIIPGQDFDLYRGTNLPVYK